MERNYFERFAATAAAASTVTLATAILHFNNNLITFALEIFHHSKVAECREHEQMKCSAS